MLNLSEMVNTLLRCGANVHADEEVNTCIASELLQSSFH